jgi:hypothetical protein
MKRIVSVTATVFLASVLWAATPPALLNYQGVLRNATNVPLSGSFDMVFRFQDIGGNEVLVDSHTAASGGQVAVSGGLFNVQLGGGVVSDGSGSGTYTSLADVFRDNAMVSLRITIGSETLAPDVPIVASPYALNASNLGGRGPDQYIDTSSTTQIKNGKLSLLSSVPGATLNVTGSEVVGHFQSGASGPEAFVGDGLSGVGVRGTGLAAGVQGSGPYFGGTFLNNDPNGGVVSLGGQNVGMVVDLNKPSGYSARFSNQGDGSSVYLGISGAAMQASRPSGSAVRGVVGTGTGVSGESSSGGIGVYGMGSDGGYFVSSETSAFTRVGTSTFKVAGTGAVSFVQNHPFDKGRSSSMRLRRGTRSPCTRGAPRGCRTARRACGSAAPSPGWPTPTSG